MNLDDYRGSGRGRRDRKAHQANRGRGERREAAARPMLADRAKCLGEDHGEVASFAAEGRWIGRKRGRADRRLLTDPPAFSRSGQGPLVSVQTTSARYTSLVGSAFSVDGVDEQRLAALYVLVVKVPIPPPAAAAITLVAEAASIGQTPASHCWVGAVPVLPPPAVKPAPVLFRFSESAGSDAPAGT